MITAEEYRVAKERVEEGVRRAIGKVNGVMFPSGAESSVAFHVTFDLATKHMNDLDIIHEWHNGK